MERRTVCMYARVRLQTRRFTPVYLGAYLDWVERVTLPSLDGFVVYLSVATNTVEKRDRVIHWVQRLWHDSLRISVTYKGYSTSFGGQTPRYSCKYVSSTRLDADDVLSTTHQDFIVTVVNALPSRANGALIVNRACTSNILHLNGTHCARLLPESNAYSRLSAGCSLGQTIVLRSSLWRCVGKILLRTNHSHMLNRMRQLVVSHERKGPSMRLPRTPIQWSRDAGLTDREEAAETRVWTFDASRNNHSVGIYTRTPLSSHFTNLSGQHGRPCSVRLLASLFPDIDARLHRRLHDAQSSFRGMRMSDSRQNNMFFDRRREIRDTPQGAVP